MTNEPQEVVKVPIWATALIVGLVGSALTSVLALGQARADIDMLKKGFEGNSKTTEMVVRHEAILPIIQNDIADVKRDIKKILVAVRAGV